jgi:hypothetical protein
MDPLDLADPGSLGSAIDGITGTVKSAQRLGEVIVEDTSFELVLPVVWALIVLIGFSRLLKFLQGWSDAGAKRYGEGARVLTFRSSKQAYQSEIAALRNDLAAALTRISELEGGDTSATTQEDVHANRQATLVG